MAELGIDRILLVFILGKSVTPPPQCVAAELGSVHVLREPPPPRTAGGGQRAGSVANVARSKDPDSN